MENHIYTAGQAVNTYLVCEQESEDNLAIVTLPGLLTLRRMNIALKHVSKVQQGLAQGHIQQGYTAMVQLDGEAPIMTDPP